eukprot:5436321-Pleurochrysis_carterae.AAC.2
MDTCNNDPARKEPTWPKTFILNITATATTPRRISVHINEKQIRKGRGHSDSEKFQWTRQAHTTCCVYRILVYKYIQHIVLPADEVGGRALLLTNIEQMSLGSLEYIAARCRIG